MALAAVDILTTAAVDMLVHAVVDIMALADVDILAHVAVDTMSLAAVVIRAHLAVDILVPAAVVLMTPTETDVDDDVFELSLSKQTQNKVGLLRKMQLLIFCTSVKND